MDYFIHYMDQEMGKSRTYEAEVAKDPDTHMTLVLGFSNVTMRFANKQVMDYIIHKSLERNCCALRDRLKSWRERSGRET
jgi:hypothetical protein